MRKYSPTRSRAGAVTHIYSYTRKLMKIAGNKNCHRVEHSLMIKYAKFQTNWSTFDAPPPLPNVDTPVKNGILRKQPPKLYLLNMKSQANIKPSNQANMTNEASRT